MEDVAKLEGNEGPSIITNEYHHGPNLVREQLAPNDRIRNFGRFRGPDRVLVPGIDFIRPDSQSFSFYSIMPPGYVFRKMEGEGSPTIGTNEIDYFEYLNIHLLDRNNNLVTATGKFFEKPGSFFGLLHEIGHASMRATLTEKEQIKRSMPIFILKPDEVEKHVIDLLQEERDASAFAANFIHTKRQEGWDFEPEIKTREQLQWLIYGPLASHEITELKVFGTKRVDSWIKNREKQIIKAVNSADFRDLIRDAVRPAQGLDLRTKSIMGVRIPKFILDHLLPQSMT